MYEDAVTEGSDGYLRVNYLMLPRRYTKTIIDNNWGIMRKDLIEDWNKVNSYDVSEMARLFAHKQSIPYSYSLDAF